MKFLNFHRRPISMYVAIAFLAMVCFWANQTPAAPTAPAPDKSSTAPAENLEGDGTGFIETEESTPHVKKGKKFPWLIVAAVLVAGGAAYYFLVLNKKYTLTVTVGEGVTGTPLAGTSSNKKGTVINYNYALQSGYSNLAVTLDGTAVAASGSVTMNANHTLAANATKTYVLTVIKGEHVTGTPNSGSYTYASNTNVPYSYAPSSGYAHLEVKIDNVLSANSGTIAMNANHTLAANLQGANIEVNSTPAGARIYLNNVDSGHVTPYTFNFTTAVTRAVHLRYSCGYKEYREVVNVALGQTKTVNATLNPGIKEEFLIPASSCWHPYAPSNWTSLLELYRYIGSVSKWEKNYYGYSFNGDYTVSVHMNRKKGRDWGSNSVFLATGSSMTSANGYSFQYQCTGSYSIYRITNFNLVTNVGPVPVALKNWTNTSAIHTGLNQFNILKVVKTGTSYAFYINNTLLTTVTDGTFTPTYLSLLFYVDGVQTEIQYNYVILTPGGAAPGSALCPTATAAAATGEGKDITGSIIQK